MPQPNILLITDDQHRWDFHDSRTVSCLRTPALSRLRAEGVSLTNAVSNCPICMPVRFTWVYGLYAGQAGEGLLRNAQDWPTHPPSMPQALRKAGYRTALVGKLHSLQGLSRRDVCAHENETKSRGFDDVLEVSGKSLAYWYNCHWTRHLASRGLLEQYRADVQSRIEQLGGKEPYRPSLLDTADSMDAFIGEHARRWLSSCRDDKPFFLHASFCGPHFPLDPPETYFTRYRPEDMPPPRGVEDPKRIRVWRERRAAYCAMIEQVDDEVGRLLEVLESRGIAQNTLVIYATDHGDMMGHMDRWQKGTPYDTSVRTPYTVRWPGRVASGRTLDDPVETVDLPCTILEAAGLGNDPSLHLPNTPGRSFLRYVTGEERVHREWAFAEHGSGWRMCRERDWKYVYQPDGEDMLFDLERDPWEQQNLIAEPSKRERVSRMRRELVESMSHCIASAALNPGSPGKKLDSRSDPDH